jgi:hypothetical protein
MDYLLELAIVNLARHILVALAKGSEQVLGQVFRVGKCGLEIFLKQLHGAANLSAHPRGIFRQGFKSTFFWNSPMHRSDMAARASAQIYTPFCPESSLDSHTPWHWRLTFFRLQSS